MYKREIEIQNNIMLLVFSPFLYLFRMMAFY